MRKTVQSRRRTRPLAISYAPARKSPPALDAAGTEDHRFQVSGTCIIRRAKNANVIRVT
jgi:hypothetical protein